MIWPGAVRPIASFEKEVPMQLRNLNIPAGAAFAPMAGLSDAACRHLMMRHGAAWSVSEMASAKAITFGDRKSLELLRDDAPGGLYAVQLFGNEPEILAQAIEIVRERASDSIFWISIWAARPPRSPAAARAAS